MRKLLIPMLITFAVFLAGCNSQTFSDSTVTATVKSKLVADSETSATKISVETKDGVVMLTGTVPTDKEKTKAEQLARNTEGVKRVTNEIKVDPSLAKNDESGDGKSVGETVNDATILAKLKAQLIADGITGTNVDVNNGSVVLNGEVEDAKEKAKAEEIAKNTGGVKAVKNQLTVKKLKGA